MSIVKWEYHHQVHAWFMALIAFSLPFNLHVNTWIVIGALLHIIISGKLLGSIQQAYRQRHAQAMGFFFLLFIFSYLISINKHEAMAMIERRASFIVLPLLFYSYHYTQEMFANIKKAFVLACLVAGIYCMGYAVYYYYQTQSTAFFFYHQLSQPIGMNAVYMSAYCIIAIIFLQDMKSALPANQRWIAGIILFIFLVLLSSKLMIVLAAPVLFIPYLYTFKLRQNILISAALLLLISAAISIQPNLKNRFLQEFNANTAVIHAHHFEYNTPFTGTTLRLLLWRFSWEILDENKAWIWGCGSGDFQDLLNQKYRQTGLYTGNPALGDSGYLGYGPHNTYIETLLSLGIIGLVAFVYIIYVYGKAYFKSGNVTGIQFLVLVLPFLFTESALSVNKGIVAITFFALLIALSKIKHNPVNTL